MSGSYIFLNNLYLHIIDSGFWTITVFRLVMELVIQSRFLSSKRVWRRYGMYQINGFLNYCSNVLNRTGSFTWCVTTMGGFGGDSPCSSTSRRERLSRDRRASRGAWSFLTRSHRSSVRSSLPVCPSSSCKQQRITSQLKVNTKNTFDDWIHMAAISF